MPAENAATQEALLRDIHEGFSALKSAVTESEKQIKQFGTSTGEVQGRIAEINSKMDATESKLTAIIDSAKADRERAEKLEKQLAEVQEMMGKKAKFKSADEAKAEGDTRKTAFTGYVRFAAKQAQNPTGMGLESYLDGLQPGLSKALIRNNDEAGGYLAPPEFVAEMLINVVEWSNVRSVARIRNTSRPAVRIPKRNSTAAATWVTETGSRTETTNPSFAVEEIPVHEMYAMVKVSWTELEDSLFNLEQFLREEFAEQFGVTEGAAFCLGNKVGKPEGLLINSSVAQVASGGATSITADSLIALYYAPKEAYISNGTWLMNRSTLRVVRQLKGSDNNYLWAPGLQREARPATILDRPYITCPDMAGPTSDISNVFTANSLPILFGDITRGYLIVDRVDMQVMTDPFTSKGSGMVEISARKRVGGQVVIPEALRVMKVSAT